LCFKLGSRKQEQIGKRENPSVRGKGNQRVINLYKEKGRSPQSHKEERRIAKGNESLQKEEGCVWVMFEEYVGHTGF